MEEDYDILGVYILGLVTAFGGGAIGNLLIGVPVSALWEQRIMFQVALLSITILFYFQIVYSNIGRDVAIFLMLSGLLLSRSKVLYMQQKWGIPLVR